jgi:hypothetical protein
MFTPRQHSGLVLALGLGLAIANGALVRADPTSQPSLADLAKARYEAANKLFDTAWDYYRQKVANAGFVYFASVRLLEAELDLGNKRENRIVAFEHHLCRVKKLQAMVAKVQGLGRVNTLETSQISYYRSEAEYWLARARSSTEPGTHHGGTDPVANQSQQLPRRAS